MGNQDQVAIIKLRGLGIAFSFGLLFGFLAGIAFSWGKLIDLLQALISMLTPIMHEHGMWILAYIFTVWGINHRVDIIVEKTKNSAKDFEDIMLLMAKWRALESSNASDLNGEGEK